jgi:hypothetical protein
VAGQNFEAGATPSLRSLVRDVAGAVSDPASNSSIASRWDGYISTLGSGSGTHTRQLVFALVVALPPPPISRWGWGVLPSPILFPPSI